MHKLLLTLVLMGTFLYSIEIPLNDFLLQKVEQKLKENSTNYTQYGFSEDEKKEYYKLVVYIDDADYRMKNGLQITSDDAKIMGEASNKLIELDAKLYKATKAEKKTRWSLFDYIKNEPNNIEKIKQLIKDGANVNVQDEEGYTPLYYAVIHNHDEIMKILIKAKANPNIESNDGFNALSQAIYVKNYELLQYLLANGGDVNHKFEKLFQNQSRNKNDYPSDNYTLLHQVVSTTNDPKFIKILIKAGADVNIKAPDNLTALKYCADDLSSLGHIRAMSKTLDELLGMFKIKHEEDKQEKSKLPFRHPTYDAVKLLLDAGAKINKNDMYLKSTSDTKTIKLLISKGANVNATDSSNETPIYTHITYGHFDAVKTLTEAGTNLNQKENSGKTPLEYCEKFGKDKKICQLIRDAMNKQNGR